MSSEYNEIFKKWGLSGNPFGTTPPDEIEQIAAISHGRDHELDMALFTLYDGKNVLIRGTWGIGKTALIKTLLYRLQQATIFSLGVFSEDINLQPMSNTDLWQIVINYLNTKRQEQNDSIAPFTAEVLDQIIEAAQGIPRQLNYICEKVIRQAAVKQYLEIDLTAWQIIWPEMQNDLLKELTPQLRRLLSVAYEEGGISENISNATLDQLGVITFNALLPELKQLESKDLMTRVEGDRGYRFVPSKLYLPPSKE
jgi:hypothetical protein